MRFKPLTGNDPPMVAGYVLRARLGGGGMGQVYLSFSPGGRPVAVKVIRAELAGDPEFRDRFRREIQAAQRVQGHYTAPVLDAGPDADVPWLATAYVAGPSLQAAVAAHGPFPLPAVFRLLAGSAEALAGVHAAGLVHRDFKPSNVLLADDGPRVIDFGIALAAGATSITGSGLRVGTAAFMAPEQITGTPVTPAADVFALALTAHYAATGRGAFGAGSQTTLAYRIVHEPPDLAGCPAVLRDLLARCLAKDPGQRPATTQIIGYSRTQTAGETLNLARSWLPPAVADSLAGYQTTALAAVPPTRPPDPPTITAHRSAGQRGPRTQPGHSGPVFTQPAAPSRSGPPARKTITAIAITAVTLLVVTISALSQRHAASPGTPGPARGPSAGPAGSSSQLSGVFAREYQDVAFTLPGGSSGCFSQGVNFTAQGPQVTTDAAEAGAADLEYISCGEAPSLRTGPGVQIATASGTPDGTACDADATQHPLSGEISYAALAAGTAFCVLGTVSSQLALIKLTSKPGSSYELSWTATGWNVPG